MAIRETPAPTADLQAAKRDFDEHGFCLVADALDAGEVASVRARLTEQAAGEDAAGVATHDAGGNNQRVWSLVNKGAEFVRLIDHPVAVEMITHALADGFLLSSLTANIARRGGQPMRLHADQGYVPRPWPAYPLVTNVMWMLDDFTEDNGATRLVPGSHKWTERPAQDPETIAGVGPAGTAMIFDGRLLHGTGANVTDAPRHGVLSYFCRSFVRQQENFTLSLASEVGATLSDELLARLGFKVQGTLGGVEGPREGAIVQRPERPITVLKG